MLACVLLQELEEFVLLGVLLSAHEKHVFAEMSETWPGLRIFEHMLFMGTEKYPKENEFF